NDGHCQNLVWERILTAEKGPRKYQMAHFNSLNTSCRDMGGVAASRVAPGVRLGSPDLPPIGAAGRAISAKSRRIVNLHPCPGRCIWTRSDTRTRRGAIMSRGPGWMLGALGMLLALGGCAPAL